METEPFPASAPLFDDGQGNPFGRDALFYKSSEVEENRPARRYLNIFGGKINHLPRIGRARECTRSRKFFPEMGRELDRQGTAAGARAT